MYHYSKHTNEVIVTDTPASWMGSTDIQPPEFDSKTASAFFEDGAWVVRAYQRPAEEAEADAKRQRAEQMLTGADYNSNPVSFTADDGNGLLQVKAAFEMGLTETVIHFANGTKMPITAEDFPAFAAWFVVERNKFFAGES